MDWVEEQIVIAVPVTLEYDPSRVGKAELVAAAKRGLTNALQHAAGYYRIEGGKAALLDQTLTDAEREAVIKVRKWAGEIANDNAFIDDVRDAAESAALAIDAFVGRCK